MAFQVAPFVGVWIEIPTALEMVCNEAVAPFVGVWIEIPNRQMLSVNGHKSPPLWGCGLKWLDIHQKNVGTGRPLCGGVD